MNDSIITLEGREYDSDELSEAIRDASKGCAPVAVMDDSSLRDGIGDRIRWSLASVVLITTHPDTDDTIIDAAENAVLHLEQARDMFSALIDEDGDADEDPDD